MERLFGLAGMPADAKLKLSDLDATLSKLSGSRRLAILCQVIDVFFDGAASYSEKQATILDAIIKSLSQNLDQQALAELSRKLAVMDGAPNSIVSRLSNDNDLSVAGRVLEKSPVLSDFDLVNVAKTKSQGHLLAIAGRKQINECVTDVLVDRGNSDVVRKITANEGASISELSFAKLVNEAGQDGNLAAIIARRKDVPPELLPFLEMAVAS